MPTQLIIDNSTGVINAGSFTGSGISASKIVQVVTASTTTNVFVATTALTDTSLTATITPTSSSNKVFVIVHQGFRFLRNSTGQGVAFWLLRGATTIYESAQDTTPAMRGYSMGTSAGTAAQAADNFFIQCLDSPATTSAVTYKVQGKLSSSASSGTIEYQFDGTSVLQKSTMTLIEVLA